MDLIVNDLHSVVVQLSRRNLRTLLAKLDGAPPSSRAVLQRYTTNGVLTVEAVPDEVAYADRPAGAVHPETEVAMCEEVRQ